MTIAIRELAGQLIALERQHGTTAETSSGDAARVCEKLRVSLARLAGTAGYHSLISRAVAIAKANAPALSRVEVNSDGSLESLDEICEDDPEAGVTVLIHLLDLLIIFIGESVTLGIARDAWPDAPWENMNWSSEEHL